MITGTGDHLRPEWPITITGMRTSVMEGTLEELRRISNCPEGATFSQLGLRKSVACYRFLTSDLLLWCGLSVPPAPRPDQFRKTSSQGQARTETTPERLPPILRKQSSAGPQLCSYGTVTDL